MTQIEACAKYPNLMAYILDRNKAEAPKYWGDLLREDEHVAEAGGLAEVALELKQAKADFGSYPYNAAMGMFLGLAIRPGNGEPEHGYYMAGCVQNHYELGVARRRAAELIAEGKELRIVTGRSKQTREPVRFAKFKGPDQIVLKGRNVIADNGKRKYTLHSNWSIETAMVNLVNALETGAAYN